MYGFEKDINKLIDAFTLQASQERCTSFQTFKQLFQLAGYAYLHQAYPGCQHSPEYIQLLYTTALDRLDVPSPTAAADSPLWRLHVPAADIAAQQTAAAAAAAGSMAMGPAAVPMRPNQGLQPQQPLPLRVGMGQQLWPSHAVQDFVDPCMLQQQPLPVQAQPIVPGPPQPHVLVQVQQQQQQQQPPWQQHQMQSQAPMQHQQQLATSLDQECGSELQQQQELLQSRAFDQQQAAQQPGPAASVADLPLVTSEADELDDDFLNDLLAIFDEVEAEEQVHASSATHQPATTAATTAPGVAAATQQPQQHQQQRLPQQVAPSYVIPLVVKAAAVFMLHCLFETQLARPRICIYVPPASLRALQTAASEFRAAGPAAVDALLVLQSLLSQQRVLVGQFRRPKAWQHQLPQYLQPAQRAATVDLGLGVAANKAVAKSTMNEWRVRAVTAAARAARSLVRKVNAHYRQDTPEHREALFHIKSTLSNLSNYKALQGLCDSYANARRAIFEPLLALKEKIDRQPAGASATANKQQEQQDSEEQQEEWWQKPKKGSKAKQKAAAKRQKSQTPPAPLAAPPAAKPAWEGSLQKWTAAGDGNVAVPELFDRSFGADLQQLATGEAARMLLLLDPAYDATKLKKRQKQQQEPLGPPAGPATGQQSEKGPAKGAASEIGRWRGGYAGDLAAAGIVQPSDLQHMQQQLGRDTEMMKAVGMAVPQQVLQLQMQRQQHAMHVAEEWFTAQDALMEHGCDDGEDMP